MIQETSLEWGAFDTTTGTVSATIHKGGKRKWRILYMKKKNLGDIRKCVDLVWIMTQTNQVKNPLRHMEKFDE